MKVSVFIVILVMILPVKGQLKTGFYVSSCPKAEEIVRSTVESYYKKDPTIAAGLLRLHFHDCFVQGCDASILIKGASTERNALPNLGLRGFEVIDDAKAQLESLCPGIVSCADIVALAARDSVDLSDGPSWKVPTGRRDGRISSSSQASSLPSPLDSIAIQRQKFAAKGLDDHDLVTLVGTVYTTSQLPEILIQSSLAQLQSLCPKDGNGSKKVALDKGSQTKFVATFFKNVKDGNAVLESDQRLLGDATTRNVLQNYAGSIRAC